VLKEDNYAKNLLIFFLNNLDLGGCMLGVSVFIWWHKR